MLKQSVANKVEKMFTGTKKVRGVKNARVIAERLGISRREVMSYLEDRGLRRYSPGSYC